MTGSHVSQRQRSVSRKSKKRQQRSPKAKKDGRSEKKNRSSRSDSRSRSRSLKKERKRKHSRSRDKQVDAKKGKRRRRKSGKSESSGSSESSSSGSSDEGAGGSGLPSQVKVALQQKQIDRDDERLKKEKMKLYETPEEKRARRLAKKHQKELKRRHKLGEFIGYSEADNPFGDPNLMSTFRWKKKEEEEEKGGATHKDSTDSSSVNTVEELEKVKKRRLEREREKALRQESIVLEQRSREREYFAQWESQEDSFHLNQAKLRSTIRIQDGRAKAIDLLAKYISTEEADQQLAVEMHDPQKFIEGLKMRDLEDLLEDIKVYMELEQGKNAEYWKDITVVVHDEIARLNSGGASSANESRDAEGRRDTMSASVAAEVNKIFAGKTEADLLKLKANIEHKLSTQANIDTVYWESVWKRLVAQMSRVRLTEGHKETLRQKLFKLKHEQGVEHSKPLFPVEKRAEEPSQSVSTCSAAIEEQDTPPPVSKTASSFNEDVETYESGRYSPKLMDAGDLAAGTILLDPEDEIKKLMFARQKYLGTGNADIDADRQLMQQAKEGGMLLDDAADDSAQAFSTEHDLNKQYLWADKYRPRKPRYFNRVHTGYEWNKYNQTHYDPENPPPKIVQGYKFNIFYPDLIDKRQTPRYSLQPIEGEGDFVVLRFSSGPPYEDIAFKIVNREWEYGHKHGYKCQFSNDIFQLWFKFKIYKYRR